MKYLLLLAALLAACATKPPATTLGPDTYQLTHTMPKAVPNAAARRALEDMARNRCAKLDNAPYAVKSEDVKIEGAKQTLSITFTCKPPLQNSAYTGSAADTMPTPKFYTPTENLVSLTTPPVRPTIK